MDSWYHLILLIVKLILIIFDCKHSLQVNMKLTLTINLNIAITLLTLFSTLFQKKTS
jgi:hypothetical protein